MKEKYRETVTHNPITSINKSALPDAEKIYKYKGPTTWLCKENLHILLGLSDTEKINAFDEIVNWFVIAKYYNEMENWIASVLSFYIKKHLPQRDK
ncbi:hypothetical protein DOT_1882 [Desulfosporosinus sp. OT]|nr:hypothetical protein DOT_1882 [Desulfosporosinus sp. OT]